MVTPHSKKAVNRLNSYFPTATKMSGLLGILLIFFF